MPEKNEGTKEELQEQIAKRCRLSSLRAYKSGPSPKYK